MIVTVLPSCKRLSSCDYRSSGLRAFYVILATDGAPNDICTGGAGGDGSAQRQGVIAAADRGAAAEITTYVISLAGDDAALQAHLEEVAKHGDPTNPMARTFSPTNPDELTMTLAQLLGGAVGCNIALSGTVKVGQECSGSVLQNGSPLPCCQQAPSGEWKCDGAPTDMPNGWRLTDAHSIEIVGPACTDFLLGSGDVLQATFPNERSAGTRAASEGRTRCQRRGSAVDDERAAHGC